MDGDRWNHVDQLLQSALELPADDRDRYLRDACGGDTRLEDDVRSLLAAHDGAGTFLGAPAIAVAARALAGERREDGGPPGPSTPLTASGDPLIGQTLSHYRIVGKLGGGGMGVVYRAEDTRLHRAVALKFVAEELSRDPEAMSRFTREAQTASALNHPNICTIYDIGGQHGRAFIVMEYLDGTTLAEVIARRAGVTLTPAGVADGASASGLPTAQVLKIGVQIADALEAAHSAGIVHRDIKPANIFVGARDHVKVLDFGLAKVQVAAAGHTELTTMAGTRQGFVMGTAAYMAPEQANGNLVDHRADIWSFGVVLYEMATGARPAPGVPLRVGNALELERIIGKCLEPDRTLRYQHAAEVRADLEQLRSGSHVTTAAPPVQAKNRALWLSLGAAAVIAAAVAGVFYGRRPVPAPLTDKDTIVLGEFVNSTGDSVFDDTLRAGLASQLQQSPFLSLVSEDRIRSTLALMEQSRDARLTPEIARSVCVRTGSAVVLDGSIAPLGSQYVLALRARNCATGDSLADEQGQAARKEDVLAALSQMTTRVRDRLGESRETIEKYSMELRDATTPSLEAWKAFITATQTYQSIGAAQAQPLFERAVALDPGFAVAYAQMGTYYSNVGEAELSRQSTIKAYELRKRASDAERFFIEMAYDRQVTGNMDREVATLEAWARTYPRDPVPHGLLAGFATRSTGRFEQTIAAAETSIALNADGGSIGSYNGKAWAELYLNRLADAEATLRRAESNRLHGETFPLIRFFIAFVKHDEEDMRRQTALTKSTRLNEDLMSHVEALALARSARLQDATRASAIAAAIPRQSGRLERAASFEAATAVWEAFYGNVAAARRKATSTLALSRGREVDYAAAFALALAGDAARARGLADDLARAYPEDTSVQFMYLPALRGLLFLGSGNAAAAIAALEPARRFDLGFGNIGFSTHYGKMYAAYVRGLAYGAARQYGDAAAEFQRILDHRSVVLVDPVDALARLQLARALTRAGDTARARSTYDELLALWTDADPGIPIVEQARAEAAQLR